MSEVNAFAERFRAQQARRPATVAGGRPTPRKRPAGRVTTQEEREELLRGYREIPRGDWPEIPAGAHIRLQKTDGTLLTGGRVERNAVSTTKPDGSGGERYFLLQGAARAKPFPMLHSRLARVWQKPEPPQKVAARPVSQGEMEGVLRKLVERVARLEQDNASLKRIVQALSQRGGV